MARRTTSQVSEILAQLSVLRDSQGKDWSAMAYLNASVIVEDITTKIPKHNALVGTIGIGHKLADIIDALFSRKEASVPGLQQDITAAKNLVDSGIVSLTKIPGVGIKRAFELQDAYRVRHFSDMLQMVQNGLITDRKLCEAVLFASQSRRIPYEEVTPAIENIISAISKGKRISILPVGSYRRRQPTVGDIDILLSTEFPKRASAIRKRLMSLGGPIVHGDSKSSIFYTLPSGVIVRVDLLVATPKERGAACCYFTGSADHNRAMRRRAMQLGMVLNEHGLWRGKTILAQRSEKDIYAALGVRFRSPWEREGPQLSIIRKGSVK